MVRYGGQGRCAYMVGPRRLPGLSNAAPSHRKHHPAPDLFNVFLYTLSFHPTHMSTLEWVWERPWGQYMCPSPQLQQPSPPNRPLHRTDISGIFRSSIQCLSTKASVISPCDPPTHRPPAVSHPPQNLPLQPVCWQCARWALAPK